MKKRIFSLLLLLCSIITGTATAQESGDKERFFPANSIRCTNVITVNFAEMDRTVPKETIYYEMWTGNDTIVDGKPCVTLWQQFDRDITTITDHPHKAFTPELEGVIYEADNGYVYFKYMNDDGNDWVFLYDFSSPNRNEGDTICLGMNDMEETVYEGIDQISTCTLHNGREVQVAEGLMYGIGYQSYPFFFPNYMWVMINAYVPIYDPINFYRNGELLWGVPYDMHSKLAANEQDLDVDGKKWHIRTQVPYIDDRYTNDVFMWIEGDTIVEDIRYKKLYKQTRNVKDSSMGTIEVGYCRQEGDKYYQDGKLMFDFGLGEGDMFATSTENEEAGFFYTVVSIGDTLLLDGLPRKYMVIAPSYEGMIKSNHTDIWIEGIGSLSMGIFENDFYYMAGLKKELQCCSYNGIYIYKKKEESKTYLVTEGKQWAVERYTMGGVQGIYSYCLQGDTIINGKEYKIEHEGCGKDLSGMKPSGRYMREENGRVYSYVHTERYKDEDEVLFFDFNLEDGDTIVYIPDVYSLHVMDVYDAVIPHSDGQTRKCYEVELWGIHEGEVYESDDFGGTFVEGIGNLCSGLSDPGFGLVGSNQRLLYVKQGDTILYQREEEKEEPKTYLVTEGKEWALCSRGFMPPPNHTTYTYRLQGDTIIDGKHYLKEYVCGDMHLKDWKLSQRYVREEKGKVYSKYRNDKETLLLDYNMKIGDIIRYEIGPDDSYYTYIVLVDIRDTIMLNGDGVPRRCYEVAVGKCVDGIHDMDDAFISYFIEDIGFIGTGLHEPDFFIEGGWNELLYVKQGDNLLYQKEKDVWWIGDHVNYHPLKQRGYGLYHGDTYLHAYTINEAEAVTDSTDFAYWNDKTVIYFDVDTIGPNAFSGATFRQGQILYFTERLNTIFKDAFTDVNIVPRTSKEMLVSDDLTLVFAGANPPGIDKNYIMDYADSTCHINYVVPDLETYIKDDIQWTYTTLMTIDDFVRGYISPENEVTVSDTTEADASVDNANAGEVGPTAPPTIRASVRPRGDIPVRIGEGENKDIYSRAPAWQYYTVEVVVTDCHADTLYTASQECRAHGQCDFVIELPYYPDGGYVYLHSRSIDMFGRATEWAVLKVQVDTAIDELLQSGTPNVYYDLQGRPVANPTRGIYIRNGRKVVL